jgi:6-phosphogluconate dehydrogenase
MGGDMARRLLAAGCEVVGFDLNPRAAPPLVAAGALAAPSLAELVELLPAPRSVWLMLPAGDATEDCVSSLTQLLRPGDTVLDGGNAYYNDSVRRAAALVTRGIDFIDVGVSGGIWGLREGYSLMVGGEADAVDRHRPIFEALAPAPNAGWGHVGRAGAGHYVKMVHNAIEYGLMQAYAEGFELLEAKRDFDLDLAAVAEIWRHGSVVRSWLLDLTAELFARDATLADVRGWVPDTGEGRWAVAEAIDLNVSLPVITQALERRIRSRQTEPFSDRLLAALRGAFGGHEVPRQPT